MSKKPWESGGRRGRRVDTRNIRDRMLIVCEGEKTEPNYFRQFPAKKDLVELDVAGIGANTLRVVREAIRLAEEARARGAQCSQVWCVFDRDEFPAKNFNDAFRLARDNGVRIAYSNQCFELWYFLHFHFNDAALHRHVYAKRLTDLLGRKYQKNDEGMYACLKDRQAEAVRNARTLLVRYGARPNPEKDDPSTTVHLLVERLNEFVEDTIE